MGDTHVIEVAKLPYRNIEIFFINKAEDLFGNIACNMMRRMNTEDVQITWKMGISGKSCHPVYDGRRQI